MYVRDPFVHPVTPADTDRAKMLVCDGVDVSVRDAVHVAVMLGNDVRRIATFDTAFDRVEGIERVALGRVAQFGARRVGLSREAR